MSGTHPADEALQNYVLDRAACSQEESDHIGSCPHCQSLIALYGVLITELDRQPLPAFDFNLAAAVMERVRVRPDAVSTRERKSDIALAGTVILFVIAVPAWLFRKSAYFVFTDMSPEFYWSLLAVAGIVVGLFILRLQKRYQHVINLINK